LNKLAISFATILEVIGRLPTPGHLWLAFSGGVDSSVLLHILANNSGNLASELTAVHVNHQLSPNAESWANHCKIICENENVEFKTIKINAIKIKGTSQEAHARELRYAALENVMGKSDLLLTAHHKDDQAETLIQQLMRGAGPEGLAGIPEIKKLGEGWLARPLLEYSREQIKDYAVHHGLIWIEDESNLDTNIDRNYIRTHVMPCLQKRWPSTIDVVTRSARHQADVLNILKEIAEQDLANNSGDKLNILNIIDLKKLSEIRMRNLIRYWLKINGHPPANTVVTETIIKELIYAGDDRMPCIRWHGTEVRRYRNNIYVMKPLIELHPEISLSWDLDQPLDFDNGHLIAKQVIGKGIKTDSINNKMVQVRFRTGGETICPAGRKETHKLKKLFQESGVPPWQRDRVPLLYVNDKLAAVTGYWIDENFIARGSEPGWEVSLTEH
jgi:tRNA(Ile)-lysidine synthase